MMNRLKKKIKQTFPFIFGRRGSNDLIKNASPIKSINLQVNDNCNSQCVMCNIWKQKGARIFDIERFSDSLEDPLFKKVESVMLTGGEPTLVKNLADYYSVMIKKLPKLKSLSLTSNCILEEKTISDSLRIFNICRENNINFNVALSFDGIGDIHDLNRGVSGNFNKVLNVISAFKNNGIPFFISTTITKINVWNLEEILNFAKTRDLISTFRVAGYADRLYNNDITHIRKFNDEEIYQIRLFFHKLFLSYAPHPPLNYVYNNIQHMIAGGSRIIDCPHLDNKIVTMDYTGSLRHCSPKGKNFCSLPEENGLHCYQHSSHILDDIRKNYCFDCIHDTQGSPTSEFLEKIYFEEKWRSFYNVQSFFSNPDIKESFSFSHSAEQYIFIIGWYGTETVGDKAILKSTVLRYKKLYPDYGIRISSLYPFVTERTLKELNIVAEVIPVYSEEFIQSSCSAHTVVVGGGPLMELEELSLILRAFHFAKKHGRQCHIYGCGIGPLHSEEKIMAVSRILDYADVIQLRDQGSVDFARSKMNEDIKADVIADPSIEYIRTLKVPERSRTEGVLACFLRELTSEYNFGLSSDDFLSFKEQFESALAENILNLCKYYGLRPYLYAMHNFVVGNDDRDFNYYMADKYLAELSPVVENKLATVQSIADAMQSSSLNLCMRFHSVVFANSLDTDYIGIDYTSGGKISHFLMERGKAEHLASMAACISSADCLLDKARGVGHFSINLPYKA